MDEQLVLIDADDMPVGTCGKMQVHREGLLHRAFSIFVFDSQGRLLLQQRAFGKYHSGGLWTNTCCGHPRPGETLGDATLRRLNEEMGFSCELRKVDTLLYRATLANGLVEHEFTHIHVGVFDGLPMPDPAEAAAWKWIDVSELVRWLDAEPAIFTVWFRYMVERRGARGLSVWAGAARFPGCSPEIAKRVAIPE
ncbi:isopentenyl-diphosphate delta-isomerase [Burkholderia lata]|uniref:isopentenyl-diphosphate Delta-isomerase n=1 Tax=Burkholderia lata (strain ATCC 17760 / DSM 23089 / LMG 22485 / NCIMB 9086 / R18194 / 383) TaxID=482957 RepID=UPI0014549EE0|nr:isopentenyl-diphosphate Delta-isomerase [Burkholderia lata]VWD04473.1 isopentenyl-diphosphate delta-isomerase [Burkholderia lata]